MTTVPLDPPAETGAPDASAKSGKKLSGSARRAPAAAGVADPSSPPNRFLHPIRSWESQGRRWLPGVWYPIAVWAVWRVGQLAVSSWLGGDWQKVPFYYDGERYIAIVKDGYIHSNFEMPNIAFFPGASWLGWPIWKLTGSEQWTGQTVATVTAIAAFVAVWGVSKSWQNEAVARKAVWLLALFPSSMYLWAFYSEGLFIALGAGAVWADRQNRRWIAAACLVGLSTTRSVAILIPMVIILARMIRSRKIDRWCFVYGAAAVIGLIPVLYMMKYYTGDPFSFFGVQKDWGRGLSLPWTTVHNGFDNLWPSPETIMVPALVARNLDLWCLPIVAFGVGWVAFARREKFPMEAWMLGVTLIILPLCSTSLASFNRFVLADWVIYPAYASFAHRLPLWWRRAFWAVVIVSFLIVTYNMVGRVSVNRFVG